MPGNGKDTREEGSRMKTKVKRIVYELIVDVPEGIKQEIITECITAGIEGVFNPTPNLNIQKLNAVYEGKPREVIV
jgi:NADH/NAD ratio-sensing transcriptional regulator Rex